MAATSNQAKVTSIEALEAFRAALIVFLTKARRVVDDSSEEVSRTRQWIQHDQRTHWEGEFRRRTKKLEQAQAELMSVRLGAAAHQESARMARQMAVAKAQRDVAEVEGKLRKLKGWSQNYDTCAEPILKRMDKLRQGLDELPKAIAYLVNVERALNAYAESGRTVSAEPSPQAEPAAAAPEAESATQAETSN
jgi:predicted transcriptional regulator